MAELLSKEERLRILRTLEEDLEFRYAMAGAMGLLEILKRLDSIEARIEEHSKRLEEHSRRIEELSLRMEGLVKAVGELKVAVGSIGRRMGLDLERAIFSVYKDVLLGLGVRDVDRIERFTYEDSEGRFFARGAKVEVDVYAHDEEAYLIEVKSLLEEEDVDWFSQKCKVASEMIGRKVRRRIIVAVNATKESLKRAEELGIDVIYGALVD